MTFQPDRIFDVDLGALWTADVAGLTGLAGLKLRSARFALVLYEEFKRGMLDLHAKSLVYTTLLSLVPFLAVSFSVLTAFGASQDIAPFLISLLEPLGETGSRVVTSWVVEFVNNVQIGVLGVLGFVVLFYFVLSLVGKIEDALNYIWRVPRGRPARPSFYRLSECGAGRPDAHLYRLHPHRLGPQGVVHPRRARRRAAGRRAGSAVLAGTPAGPVRRLHLCVQVSAQYAGPLALGGAGWGDRQPAVDADRRRLYRLRG